MKKRSTKSRRKLNTLLPMLVASLIVFCLHALAFAETDSIVPTAQKPRVAKFTKRPYVGAGFGVTRLNPEDDSPSIGVSDESSTGYHLTLGYDLSRWLSAEIYVADLGSAEIEFLGTDVGPVDYTVAGVSAIGYLFNSQSGWLFSDSANGMHRREGLSLYTRVGVGVMDNDTDLEYNRDYDAHLAVGLGAEYGFKNGFALRGEVASLDADAQYASLSVLKRFGKVPAAALAAPIAVAAVPDSSTTAAPQAADVDKTASLSPYVYFEFNQHALSPGAMAGLDVYAAQFAGTDQKITLEGHADWIGSEAYNQPLSERRANAVYQYFLEQGIAAQRMSKIGYGESRPISSNSTVEGRAQNRRVEIIAN